MKTVLTLQILAHYPQTIILTKMGFIIFMFLMMLETILQELF